MPKACDKAVTLSGYKINIPVHGGKRSGVYKLLMNQVMLVVIKCTLWSINLWDGFRDITDCFIVFYISQEITARRAVTHRLSNKIDLLFVCASPGCHENIAPLLWSF